MAYQIYFSNPNEFLRNLIIAILRIKKHSKTITESEKQLLVASGMDISSESNNAGEEANSKPPRRAPIKNREPVTTGGVEGQFLFFISSVPLLLLNKKNINNNSPPFKNKKHQNQQKYDSDLWEEASLEDVSSGKYETI